MRRREFIALLGCVAITPLAAHAQQPITPLIGFLHPGSPEANTSPLAAFRKGCRVFSVRSNVSYPQRFLKRPGAISV
jgi:hypothetical protein